MNDPSTTVICTYRVRAGCEEDFVELLRQHWPKLHELGLVTDEPTRVWRGTDGDGGTYFVEVFTWKEPGSPEAAHHSDQVMAVWEPMGALCEARGGRPAMEFPHVDPVDVRRP